jgi:adenylate kinase family enzyme
VSGSGKTTYARRVADALDVAHLELDSVFHQPNWTPIDISEFRSRVGRFVAGDEWTIDGNYSRVNSLVMARTEVVVAMELPKRVVMRQISFRTIARGARRTELWNGNRESLFNVLRPDPYENMILWTFTRYERYLEKLAWYEKVAKGRGVEFVRVRSHDEASDQIATRLGPRAEAFLG